MTNQEKENEKPLQKKPINIVFSVDDVHPEIGYGLLKNNDQFKYLKKLNDEFGLKFTLFLIPFWHGIKEFDIQKHKDWITWIQTQGFYEIAAHGVTHAGNKQELGAMELMNISTEELSKKIQDSKKLFLNCGVNARGFKTPGWEHPKELYAILPTAGFEWIADHFIGEKPIIFSNDLVQLPYNCNTEELHNAFPRETAILHSHISPKEGNKNGWTETLYQSVRNYLLELQKTRTFVSLTMSEWIDSSKPK